MEFLKLLLGDDLAAKVAAGTDDLLKQVVKVLGEKKLIVDDGSYVPKSELGKDYIPKHVYNEDTKALKDQLKKNGEDFAALKVKADGVPELEKQIADIQKANKTAAETFETSQARSRKSFALLSTLMNEGVRDASDRELLAKNFDLDKLDFSGDGTLKGHEATLKALREKKSLAGVFGEVDDKEKAIREQTLAKIEDPDMKKLAGELSTPSLLSFVERIDTVKLNPGGGNRQLLQSKDLFTRQEIDSFTQEEMVKDPKLLEKVNRSLAVL